MGKFKKVLLGGLAIGGLAAVYAMTRRKDTVSIVLKENLTEGYLWSRAIETDGVVTEISTDYVPAFADSETGDSYGEHKWTFAPVAPGETMVHFSYIRPWKSDEPPAATAVYKMTVDSQRKLAVELVDCSETFHQYPLSVG